MACGGARPVGERVTTAAPGRHATGIGRGGRGRIDHDCRPFCGVCKSGLLHCAALHCIQVQVQVRAGVQPRPLLAGSSCLILSCLSLLACPIWEGARHGAASSRFLVLSSSHLALEEAQHAVLEVGLFFLFHNFPSFLCVSVGFWWFMLYLGRGSLADGTLPRRSKVFFFYFYFYSFFFISHHQHSTMIMLERSWPALLSFFLSIIILFFLSACLSCRGPSVISFGDPPLLALQVLSVRLPVPWLHTHPVTQTLPPPGLALAAGQTGQARLQGHASLDTAAS